MWKGSWAFPDCEIRFPPRSFRGRGRKVVDRRICGRLGGWRLGSRGPGLRYLSIFLAWRIGRGSGFKRSRDLSLRILDASRCLAGCRLAELLGGHWLMELGGFRSGGGLFGPRRRILARRLFVLGR